MEFLLFLAFMIVMAFVFRDSWPEDPVEPGTYTNLFKKKEHPATARKRYRSNLTTYQRAMRRGSRRGGRGKWD